MKTQWLILGPLQCCILCSLAIAAAYPEPVWVDTNIGEIAYDYGLSNFQIEPELFRASALKPQCVLGSQLGCRLQ